MKLLDLSWYQRQHDATYHHDVWVMSAMKKISHLTHHLNKYLTHLDTRDHSYVDIFVTVLSMTTVFPTDLGKVISNLHGKVVKTIDQVPQIFNSDKDTLVYQIRLHISHLSKIVEGFDHVEDIDYRKQINNAIAMLFILSIQLYYTSLELGGKNYRAIYSLLDAPLSLNTPYMNSILLADYHSRLLSIRSKNPFEEYYSSLLKGTVNKTSWGIIHDVLDQNLVVVQKP